MLIMSQLDDKIINLDNVNSISINESNILVFDNSYNGLSDCSEILGTYSTYERAKEVLADLISEYQDIDTRVYYMPKE